MKENAKGSSQCWNGGCRARNLYRLTIGQLQHGTMIKIGLDSDTGVYEALLSARFDGIFACSKYFTDSTGRANFRLYRSRGLVASAIPVILRYSL